MEKLVFACSLKNATKIADDIDKLGYCEVREIKGQPNERAIMRVIIYDKVAKSVIPEIITKYDKD